MRDICYRLLQDLDKRLPRLIEKARESGLESNQKTRAFEAPSYSRQENYQDIIISS